MPVNSTGFPASSATAIVVDGYNNYFQLGERWLNEARYSLNTLGQFQVQPINFSVDYSVDDFLPGFVRPNRPTAPTFRSINAQTPALPTLADAELRELGDAPEEPNLSAFLNYAPPTAPTAAVPQAPSDINVVLDPINVPDRPGYVLPELPTLYGLNLPAIPEITFPEFEGQRPTFNIPDPEDGQLAWSDSSYSSALLDGIRATLGEMMQGKSGLPLAVEQAIFDRGRAREDRLSRKQVQEVSEDMASRNLGERSGIFAARLREVRADNREKVAGLNRDLTIQIAEHAREDLKFAVTQGMALEQVLLNEKMQINDRALRAAMYVRDYGIARINAMIGTAGLYQQQFIADAQVQRDRIAAELSKLEKTRLEIENQRLVGEINRDLLAQYDSQWRGVQAMADFYRTDVEAAKTKGELNLQKIEGAKLLLQKYDTEVTGWSKLWDGYKSQVEAELGRTKFGETLANVYGIRMQGYRTKGEAYFNEGRFKLDKNGQTLALFSADLQRASQDLGAQIAELEAQTRVYTTEISAYEADGNIAQAEAAALDRAVNLKIENERNRTTVALEQGKILVDQLVSVHGLLLQKLKGQSDILAQLAAASQSAVNLGASISGSGSTGISQGFQWSGEAADFTYNPPLLF